MFGVKKVQELQRLVLEEQERQGKIEAKKAAYQYQIKQYALLAGLTVFLIIAFILYRNNRQKYTANKLLQNKNQEIQRTLSELRSTQTQLIQREKMASLGELTAGIAHEIQNPLNFVNNFSEVSIELVTELEDEQQKQKRDPELEADLLGDLKQNLQKITHHGQRASSIVKGMLEHSRNSTGERQLTNLNTLTDEYLRLAYQGMRAKNKSFNCELVTDFDPDLGLVEVVPQEIGRVLLNLFNNALYAVHQRQQQQLTNDHPTVTVQTSQANGQLEIRVRDNGTGIPDAVKAKIFQPFFTTKPTGEGTGLGLSLSYDIVMKGHNGSLLLESIAGQETQFVIQLPITNRNA
jgi:two-component system NtrC family sensor kinase